MTKNRIPVRTCHAMKLIVTLILAWKIFDPQLSNCSEMSAVIVGEPSNIINLENTTVYTVFCVLTKKPPDVNSSHLILYEKNKSIESEILNETTIFATVNTEQNAACNSIRYHCKTSLAGKLRGLSIATITIGRPPAVIPPENFICISEHRRYIHCGFPAENKCDLDAHYTLSTVLANEISECKWWHQGDAINWDSRNGSCAFTMEDSCIRFKLVIRNNVGARTLIINVTHEDVVKPGKPNNVTATSVTATSAKVTWNMPELNVLRQFKYEFRLISEYGVGNVSRFVTEPKMISSYLLEDLIPHTNYTFKVRMQVVPDVLRPFDNLYWSKSESVMFKTAANHPTSAPTVAPGAYSFKKRSNGLMNVSVFWKSVPDHLHNGTGFGYRVSAVSDTGDRFTTKVNVSTFTFSNLPIGHYRIRVWSFNDEGESEDFNEMQIFQRIDNRQPRIHAVFKAGGYNVSWITPGKTRPSSYTLMNCIFTSEGTCHDSIQFVTLPAGRTNFVTSQDNNNLNFAVSANYADNYSSELSWQHCVVAPQTSQLSAPKYHIENVTAHTMIVRMVVQCEEYSFYERIQIKVQTLEGRLVLDESYNHFVETIDVRGLESSTNYEVVITAFDSFGKSAKEVTRTCTESSGILLCLLVIIVFGTAAMILLLVIAFRKLKYVLDIKVDIPIRLLENQEDSEEGSEPEDHEEYFDMTCPTIPEEIEPIPDKNCEPICIPGESIPVEPEMPPSSELASSRLAGPYIEMLSWKRPLETDQPKTDDNGNYEQMQPPSNEQNVFVRLPGYVKMNLFINRTRTGNYTQTLV